MDDDDDDDGDDRDDCGVAADEDDYRDEDDGCGGGDSDGEENGDGDGDGNAGDSNHLHFARTMPTEEPYTAARAPKRVCVRGGASTGTDDWLVSKRRRVGEESFGEEHEGTSTNVPERRVLAVFDPSIHL